MIEEVPVATTVDRLENCRFKRVVLVDSHGGSEAAVAKAVERVAYHLNAQAESCKWWHAPRTWAEVTDTDTRVCQTSWTKYSPSTQLPRWQRRVLHQE